MEPILTVLETGTTMLNRHFNPKTERGEGKEHTLKYPISQKQIGSTIDVECSMGETKNLVFLRRGSNELRDPLSFHLAA